MTKQKITKEDVKKIAQLANIGIDEKDIEKLQRDMESILDYVGRLNEIDTKDVPPTSYTVNLLNVLREDGEDLTPARKDLQNIEQKEFLGQAPERHGEHFKVQPIFGEK